MPGHDAVVHFAAESHVDRSIARRRAVRARPTWSAPRCCSTPRCGTASAGSCTSPPTRCTARSTRAPGPRSWPLAPNSPYSASKAGSDLLALAYHRTHGLDVVVTRCSNNYGPYQFPEKVIPLFVTNLLDGGTVPLYGDGGNVRDWLHVADHCRGIQLALAKGRAGEVYHIGGGTELTNRELTELLLGPCGAGWDGRAGGGPQGPRPPLLRWTSARSATSSATPRRSTSSDGLAADRRLVPGQPRLVGAAEGSGGAVTASTPLAGHRRRRDARHGPRAGPARRGRSRPSAARPAPSSTSPTRRRSAAAVAGHDVVVNAAAWTDVDGAEARRRPRPRSTAPRCATSPRPAPRPAPG